MAADKPSSPQNHMVVDDSMTVGHVQNGLTVGHIQQALGGAQPDAQQQPPAPDPATPQK